MAVVGNTGVNSRVTADDQKSINLFARLHQNFQETKKRLDDAHKDLENLNDATDELLLLDDTDMPDIPINMGCIFLHYDRDCADSELESMKKKLESKISELKGDQTHMEEEMNMLKATLYGKFGNSINLEAENDI